MKHKGTIVLESKRLCLRPFRMSDAPAMYKNWANDENVTKYLSWPAHKDISITKMILEEWVPQYEDPKYYQWGITLQEHPDEVIGCIGVVSMREAAKCIHIGYCLSANCWHQGIMSEALSMLIDFFFKEVLVNRIESQHDVANPNSGKVMLKCGMTKEALLHQYDYNNQGIVDTCMYAILASDYNK